LNSCKCSQCYKKKYMVKTFHLIKRSFFLSGLLAIGVIAGCNKAPVYTPPSRGSAVIEEFWLEKTEGNPNLNRPYQGMISGDTAIRLMVDYGTDITALEPTILSMADSISPKGKQNFTNPVQYKLWTDGKPVSYKVTITVSPVQSPVIKSIAAGFSHVVAIKNDGTVWVCGNNFSGQLGLGDYSSRNVFTQVPIYDADQVFTGDAATVIKLKDGTAWGAGNQYGQLGLGHKHGVATFIRVPFFDDVTQIAITFSEVFVLKPGGTVWGAGRNWGNILVQDDADLRVSFVKIPIDNIKKISACGLDIVAQKTNGEIWGWGSNIGGQLGLGDNLPKKTPVQLPVPPVAISKIFVGGSGIFLMDNAGKIWASGTNTSGQLAVGDLSSRYTFTELTFFNDKSIDVIIPHTSATSFVETNGTIWNVGSNSFGLMGLGNKTTLPYTTPVQLPDFIASATAGNGGTVFALKSDGTLWAWGANQSGALGTGTGIAEATSPIQIK
jgi:alpha-tubulin suppressor-like RCC1 family protein